MSSAPESVLDNRSKDQLVLKIMRIGRRRRTSGLYFHDDDRKTVILTVLAIVFWRNFHETTRMAAATR